MIDSVKLGLYKKAMEHNCLTQEEFDEMYGALEKLLVRNRLLEDVAKAADKILYRPRTVYAPNSRKGELKVKLEALEAQSCPVI